MGNTAPVVDTVAINQATPHTNDTLSVTVTSHDNENDPVTYSYQWIKNGADIAGETDPTLDLSIAGNGDRGNLISVRVTANDGFVNSSPLTSSAVTILNTAPTATVGLDDNSPDTNATLTATATKADADLGDTVTLTYVWKVNGSTVKTTSNTASLTDTLDLSVGGNGNNGDTVSVTVTPSDGSLSGSPVSDSATVGNSAPVVDTVTINQASPHTNDNLTTTVTAHDPDGPAPTLTYQWTKNTNPIGGATASTLNLATAGNGDRGDVIRVVVTAHDGSLDSAPVTSSPVTVLNSAPSIPTASISPSSPNTNQLLTASFTSSDLDGDTVTPSYQWTKNTNPISGATGSTLNLATAGNGDKGDQIRVVITGNDGSVNSSPTTSSPVTVQNSAPSILTASISPSSPTTNQLLTASFTSSDLDGDTVTPSYQWTKNNNPIAGATGSTLNLATAGNGDKGDQIRVVITGNDGSVNSSPTTSSPVTVQNSAPTISSVLINQASPHTNDTLSVSITSGDVDGDTLSFSYQWIKNGNPIGGATLSTLDLALAGNGDRGDAISVQVTAFDGTASSNSPTSSAVTVLNTAPTATVSLDNHSPSTSATITATATKADIDSGDTVTLTYVWKVNGSTVKTTSNTASLTDTLNLATPGNGDNGDTVTVTVTPSDGSLSGTPVTDSASVGNAAPSISSVTIDQSAPHTNDVLTVTVVASDPDLDTLTYTYQWRKGVTDIAGENDPTLDLGTAGNGDKGNTISVRVVANDGSANSAPVTSSAVTVQNSAPTMSSATIDQASPHTNDVLSVTVASADVDGDGRTYTYQWRKGVTDIAGATGATLNLATAGNGDKGDQISVRVVANDGSANSSPLTSSAVTILNTAPSATVSLNDNTPDTNATLTATATKADIDPGETITLTYVWKVNGTTKQTTVGTQLTDTFDLSIAGQGDNGDSVTVTVTPNDGTVSGTPANDAATVTGGGGGGNAPVAQDANYGVSKAQPRVITLPATDADLDPLTYTIVTPPNSGTVSAGTGSSRTYTPVNSFVGTVTFTFRANDGTNNSNLGTVTITIAPMKKLTINDASFNPANATPAMCGAVRFVNKGTTTHSVTDTSGLNLFSSGAIAPNAEFDYRYSAAGNYAFVIGSTTGRAKVPMKFSAIAGSTSTVFTIQWACEDPLPGYVFDVQIKRAGTTQFVNWQTGVTTMSALYTPDAGTGSYKFRARMRNTAGGAFSDWSAAKKITVS